MLKAKYIGSNRNYQYDRVLKAPRRHDHHFDEKANQSKRLLWQTVNHKCYYYYSANIVRCKKYKSRYPGDDRSMKYSPPKAPKEEEMRNK